MKAFLRFDPIREAVELRNAINGTEYLNAISDIHTDIFRAIRKYDTFPEGFKLPEGVSLEQAKEIVHEIELAFLRIIKERDIDIW